MINYSIVISVFNQAETLKLALESLRRQIRNPKVFEIVIADDGSCDDTADFVRKLRYPIFLKYSRSEENLGRAQNRNRGFEKASGQWLIFLDGDMAPGPDFIEAYLAAWEAFPDGVSLGAYGHPDGWPKSSYHRYLESRGRLVMEHGAPVPGKYFTSGNFAIKKTTLQKLGGFDTTFEGWGGEDTDFGLRLEKAGVPLHFIPKAYCKHYHNKSLNDLICEYEKFGREGYPLLRKKYPDEVIFEQGWLLGLPDSIDGPGRRAAALALWPLRSGAALGLLRRVAGLGDGVRMSDFFFDWLFYGHLAKGYRHRAK